ncbi:MAG: Spy/CpxP family protein refolding chaperone [Bacteroidales bacterium]|nr:Spy/CpxP family protein refolding chaperone [Bacteroidales bacterium]
MRNKFLTFALTMLMLFAASATFAQQPQCDGERGRQCPLGLTDDQAKKMEQLRDQAQKKVFQLELQIKEKKAHLDVLRYADNADMKAINATIDEIARLKAEKMKAREANIQDMRKMLTDEQRIKFDAMGGKCFDKGFGKQGKKHCDGDNDKDRPKGQRPPSQGDKKK